MLTQLQVSKGPEWDLSILW